MNIALSPSIEKLLKNKVADGVFSSMDEAITFAIKFTFIDTNISNERIEVLNAEIEKGWQDIKNGRCQNGDKVMQDFIKKYA